MSRIKKVCISITTGKKQYEAKEISGHPSFEAVHPIGDRVIAYFGSYGLLCFGINGEKLWDLKMPLTKSFAGNATSPAIYDNRVVLYRANHVDHFLIAFDKYTGEEIGR